MNSLPLSVLKPHTVPFVEQTTMESVSVFAEFLDYAGSLADLAHGIAVDSFRKPAVIEFKIDSTPVTQTDRTIEQELRTRIEQTYPSHGILGEEQEQRNPKAEWVWVLDPIDGTKAFISGKHSFGILIALCYRDKPVLGMIEHPALNERWVAANGWNTRLNGQNVRARSSCTRLSEARFSTTEPELLPSDLLALIRQKVGLVSYGGDSYQYSLLASGYLDLVVETGLSFYDFCALVPVVEQAGGVICDGNGQRPSLHSDGTIVAAASVELAAETLALISQVQ